MGNDGLLARAERKEGNDEGDTTCQGSSHFLCEGFLENAVQGSGSPDFISRIFHELIVELDDLFLPVVCGKYPDSFAAIE